jgi:hypothetical protein
MSVLKGYGLTFAADGLVEAFDGYHGLWRFPARTGSGIRGFPAHLYLQGEMPQTSIHPRCWTHLCLSAPFLPVGTTVAKGHIAPEPHE